MYRYRRTTRKHKGIGLFAAMLFVVIFSAIAVGMFSMSTTNTLSASKLHTVNEARASAESGLEVVRYYIQQVTIPGSTSENSRFSEMANDFVTLMNNDSDSYYAYDHSSSTDPHIHVGFSGYPVSLDSSGDSNFFARITPDGTNGVKIETTGQSDDLDRTIAGGFTYGVRQDSVFDFGVATKGPLSLIGNIQLDGVNISVESDVYIESMGNNQALEIVGNSQIAGDVDIVNPDGYVTLEGGKAGIGGETGIDAVQNHVEVGVEATEFPYPDTSHFEQYVDGITIDSTNIGTFSTTDGTFENIRIAAGTNPQFSGNVQLNGVVFIETPNVVTFTGNVDITGLIIGDGDMNDNSGTNQINITGNVSSNSVSDLPESFGDLRDETGTFMMAPGFTVSMGGSFDTLNGCIAANGVEFFGNAGGVIGGSVINYSTTPMELSGNADLYFNRSGITDIPAGFVPTITIHYDPTGYDEVL